MYMYVYRGYPYVRFVGGTFIEPHAKWAPQALQLVWIAALWCEQQLYIMYAYNEMYPASSHPDISYYFTGTPVSLCTMDSCNIRSFLVHVEHFPYIIIVTPNLQVHVHAVDMDTHCTGAVYV